MKINVIGAGIIGTCLAHRLAQRGAEVTLIDAHPPGGLASAASFGWINASFGNPKPYFDLRTASMALWQQLKSDDPNHPFEPSGTLILHYDVDHQTHYKAQTDWGYPLEWMDKQAITKAEPNLTTDVERALFAPSEGQLDVEAAARYFAHLFKNLGGRIQQAKMDKITLEDADMTVLAAGSASADLANTLGVDIPMSSPAGLLVYSKPLKSRVINHTVLTDGLHIQQRPDGRLVAGADFGGGALNDDPDIGSRAIFARLKQALPAIKLELDGHTLGKRPTPIDGLPIIGKAKTHKNLYITVMHSGATLAPIVAELASKEIINDQRDPLLAPFGADRFSKGS